MPDSNFSTVRRSRVAIFNYLELAIIVILALIPLFTTYPYRVNIFLSWEGAYRMSEGQVPYKDFGMPMGFMFWAVPALFFKIFGAQLITLVKAQVLLNIVSGLAFRSILKSLGVQPGIRLISVLLYTISYSFFNFWPWYNHTVIVYQMVALAFLMKFIFLEDRKREWIPLVLSALFTTFSFFTKQDGGALAFTLCSALLLYHCVHARKGFPLLWFFGSFALFLLLFILPFLPHRFGYWFNYGQPPHTARLSPYEILDDFFTGSEWIKFYIFLILLLVIHQFKHWREFLHRKRETVFLLLTLGILAEAVILGVTSYTPPFNNIFFHSFAVAYLLHCLAGYLNISFNGGKPLLVASFALLLWWSGVFWKYFHRIMERVLPQAEVQAPSSENVVNRRTYMLASDTNEIPLSDWVFSNLRSFEKIYMPRSTVQGIDRLLQMDLVKRGNGNLRVLNMTELTPLAVEMPYQLERGSQTPLWYHLGVSMFNREAQLYEKRIAGREYDLVLFEYVPTLNNFYPFRVRDSLLVHYQKIDSFAAPRRGNTYGTIEVFTRPGTDSTAGTPVR